MEKSPYTIVVLAVAAAAALGASQACAAEPDPETRSEVPALTALHEVVFPLWHGAWPKKDYALMKELLPQARAGVAKVAEARLPGILRDKKSAWEGGVGELRTALAQYESAAAAGSEPALLEAVEAFHARYEALVRLTRPPMKELDAFHVPLYRVYHHELAAKAWPAVATSSRAMVDACHALAAAPLPKRFASRETTVRPEMETLCRRSDDLAAKAAGSDREATAAAVGAVHSQYEKVEGLLR